MVKSLFWHGVVREYNRYVPRPSYINSNIAKKNRMMRMNYIRPKKCRTTTQYVFDDVYC